MANLLNGVRQLLIDAGLTAYILDCPNTCDEVCIVPYGSENEEYAPVGTQLIQIRCGGDTFEASESVAWTAYHALDWQIPTCDRTIVGAIRTEQEPYFYEQEENRYIHIFNIAVSAVIE